MRHIRDIAFVLQNGRELNSRQFARYFEKKVFSTIRRQKMLDSQTRFTIKQDREGKYKVLSYLLSKYPNSGRKKAVISADCLDDAAESIILSQFKGRVSGLSPENRPFYFVTRKEIEIYARLKNIKLKRPTFSDAARMIDMLEQEHKEIKYSIVSAFLSIKCSINQSSKK